MKATIGLAGAGGVGSYASGYPGTSGTSGGDGHDGEYGLKGKNGGNGANGTNALEATTYDFAGGMGGSGGGGGGNGGDGGWGAPGTIKLQASTIFADAGARFVADNGNGDADASRLGRMTFISNLSRAQLGNLKALCGNSFLCGSIAADYFLCESAPYAGAQDLPLLGQLVDGRANTSGFIASGNRSWLLAKEVGTASQCPDGSREYCLKGLFDDFDQCFVENPTGTALAAREMTVNGLAVRVPAMPTGSVWTTTIPHEETLPFSRTRLDDGTVLTIPNLWFQSVLKFPPAPGGNGIGSFDGIGLEQSPGTDYEGKTWQDGSPVYVWQDWIAGTDPLDSSDLFHTRIEFRDGVPVILPSHDLGAERAYIVDGKETLDGVWGQTNANSRFFRVRVAIPGTEPDAPLRAPSVSV
ncbi:MAG: hypothetical protein IJQ73_03535 [Kiritimatiellae bacterium]|nr:hypothetical protein [Kiritimatiellia bacterium]